MQQVCRLLRHAGPSSLFSVLGEPGREVVGLLLAVSQLEKNRLLLGVLLFSGASTWRYFPRHIETLMVVSSPPRCADITELAGSPPCSYSGRGSVKQGGTLQLGRFHCPAVGGLADLRTNRPLDAATSQEQASLAAMMLVSPS